MPKVPKQHIKKAFAKDHRNLKLTDGAITAVFDASMKYKIDLLGLFAIFEAFKSKSGRIGHYEQREDYWFRSFS